MSVKNINKIKAPPSDLVPCSRAGDVFHYRWAARRCLKLIQSNTTLNAITIEGSQENNLAGEYIIDTSEYYGSEGSDKKIQYFQLKHSTKHADQHFTISDLKHTIEQFAFRFIDLFCGDKKTQNIVGVKFSIVSNRPISSKVKKGIEAIARREVVTKTFQRLLKDYTKLEGDCLQQFCSVLSFHDQEGNYIEQRRELNYEIASLLSGNVDHSLIDSVIGLVQEHALPDKIGKKIVREDILKRLGVSSEKELFPAPSEFEKLDNPLRRAQHQELLGHILQSTTPIIIHASGGVGKSVVARQLANSLPLGSLGIVYDCFGSGMYLTPSKPRHRHRDALVQIINEIAAYGICEVLIPRPTDLDDQLLRAFLDRLRTAGASLKETNKDAVLAIIIDAADNAEMAAQAFDDKCFAHQLLRENVPEWCKIVMFSRTERVEEYLKPSNAIQQFLLNPFNQHETLDHLQRYFPDANIRDAVEFHRLTGGNPRVQAYALSDGENCLQDVLIRLGPNGSTVDDQILAKLDSAIGKLKDMSTEVAQCDIDAICYGLANLYPLIPIKVLAAAANVDDATVNSFIADLGRPLWVSENSVQFRDEPTESWFKQRFPASVDQLNDYVSRLKPLASVHVYVSEVLPSLLHKSGNYDELVRLALSDELLPSNPIDARNIRISRLQFSFKSALKQKRYADSSKLAMRAGEEVSSVNRQIELFRKNVDLMSPLQSEHKVLELALRRMICSEWDGSENVYSAALLSSVKDFHGEAKSYLRSAERWLLIYFNDRENNKERHYEEKLKDDDLVELAFAHFNLSGPKSLLSFIHRWRPKEVTYRITAPLIKRLVDAGTFDTIEKIALIGSRDQYLIIAIADKLLDIGKYPPNEALADCLLLFTHKKTRIVKPVSQHDDKEGILSAILSFAEACVASGLPQKKILRLLRHYFPQKATRWTISEHQNGERSLFLRSIALVSVLSGKLDPDIELLIPQELLEKKNFHQNQQDITEFKQIIGALLPWYMLRSRVLNGDRQDIEGAIQNAEKLSNIALSNRWRENTRIPHEITQLYFEILAHCSSLLEKDVKNFIQKISKKESTFWISDRIRAVRAAYRLPHLTSIRHDLEVSCDEMIKSFSEERPEDKADWYVSLARAVLPVSQNDAAAYFEYAVKAISKFGDEALERWEALLAIAARRAESKHTTPETVYRFVRCAELIGNYVEEKHFGRDKVIELAQRLSPSSAFTALSRWRDRDIGRFDYMLSALANDTVSLKTLSPAAGWSLSAFKCIYPLYEFAILCIKDEPDNNHRQYILDSAVHDLRLEGVSYQVWEKMKQIADQYKLKNTELEKVISFTSYNPKPKDEGVEYSSIKHDNKNEPSNIDWEGLLYGLNLTSSIGLHSALERFHASPFPHCPKVFWKKVFEHTPDEEASTFIKAIAETENADHYDILNAYSNMPDTWRKKASVRKVFPEIVQSITRRFARELTNCYRRKHFFEDISAEKLEPSKIQEAIMQGLSESSLPLDASEYFGFIGVISPALSSEESGDLLDFSLFRLEVHMEKDFADGPWAAWLTPPEEITDVFAGFIWSALGSPRSSIRWQAAHCIKRLAETDCAPEIGALIEWMSREDPTAFLSRSFPFYKLHAQLYFMIALARVALDNSKVLRPHHSIFSHHALHSIEHVLIQKYAAQIALSIETDFPGTYEPDEFEALRQVGISQMPVKKVDGNEYLESPWHTKDLVDQSLRFYFSFDFDSHWFNPLGNVFGLAEKDVKELARNIIAHEWKINIDNDSFIDPRSHLWHNAYDRETWHDHASYPKTDDYRFYLSYHSMFVVAAKFLKELHVVYRDGWSSGNEWADWLHRHNITRTDGRWLADRRDPAPLERREWINKKIQETWLDEIMPDDFLEGLFVEYNGESWLNVRGQWDDHDNNNTCEESFNILSALVLPETSQSLLNALSTCNSAYLFKLPDYEEDDFEYEEFPFKLKGWIYKGHEDNGIDEFDLHAGDIDFPPFKIGSRYEKKINITHDIEFRKWYLPHTVNASAVCEIWSDNKGAYRNNLIRNGLRMSASLELLKELCRIEKRELIFSVEIERRLNQSSYSYSDENKGKTRSSYFKIYILSEDGRLRDERRYYQFR